MNDALQNVALGIAASILYALVAVTLGFVWSRFRQRRKAWALWPFAAAPTVILAKSVETDTGKYTRPATGLGQARALALVAPSLTRTRHSLDANSVLLADAQLGTELEGDLVLLGGPKNNYVTWECYQRLTLDWLTLNRSASEISWDGETYEGAVDPETGKLETDFGYVIRAANPWNSRHSLVVILAGCHTYGTLAAARWYVEESQRRDSPARGMKQFAALVRSDMVNRHVSVPKLVHLRGFGD